MRALYGLLGNPVAHSRSPAIHTRAFALLGVDAEYRAIRVEPHELVDTIAKLFAVGCRGFNVTVPYKETVAPMCASLSTAAAQIGAVNCVQLVNDEYVGHNTDAPGLLRALRAHGVKPAGAHAVVVGAGGSARAAAWALTPHASLITVVNRTEAKARALAQLVRAGGGKAETAPWGAIPEADLIVHCTTIGLGTAEVPFEPPRSECTLVDLVYAPGGKTELLKRFAGRCIDGIDVLVHQAIASLEIWLGRPQLDDLAGPLREAALS